LLFGNHVRGYEADTRSRGEEIAIDFLRDLAEKSTLTGEVAAMKSRLSQHAQHALCIARELTTGTVAGSILPEHLALGILEADRCVAVRALRRLGADVDRLTGDIATRVASAVPTGSAAFDGEVRGSIVELFTLRLLSERAGKVMDVAYKEAISLGDPYVGTEHMLLALVSGGEAAVNAIFKREQVTYNRLRELLQQRAVSPSERQ
jgi:ATP-dependent Clp protease ATP-binding subunit ClpC